MKLSAGRVIYVLLLTSQPLLAQEDLSDISEVNQTSRQLETTAYEAQVSGGLCSSVNWPKIKPLPPAKDKYTHVSADEANLSKTSISHFSGNVSIQHQQLQIEADTADYSYLTETLDAKGNVKFTTKGLYVMGDSIHAELKKEKAFINDAIFFTDTNASGKAKMINQLDASQIDLHEASYTTCDPKDPDWNLKASKVHLDRTNETGYATHMVMEFNDIPFFYFPYARFPLTDKRLSGFLFPVIGNSNVHGFQFQIPYYWNIAPNYDATITPWYMNNRGTMLQTEFRYLHSINSGYLKADYLNDDKLFGDSRERLTWKHQGNPFNNWSSMVNYNHVSDNRYLTDFGNRLNTTSITHLDQQGSLSYRTSNWSANLLAQSFQTLSITSNNPYERLPQLRVATQLPKQDNTLSYDIQGEWIQFDNEDTNKVTGSRLDIIPSVSLPLRNQAAFLTSKLAWHFTQYDLEPNSSFTDTNPARNLPVVSLDSGLFFDRDTSFSDLAYVQTLEPRLYYVYAPYRDQDNLPIFDTQQSRFNVNEPIKDDFFDGADRVEDANRITAMLTTRFIEQTSGKESLMAGIGQIYYFADGRVTLPGAPIRTDRISNVLLQLAFKPNQSWNLLSDAQWDPDRQGWDLINAILNYRYTDSLDINLAYHTQHIVLTTTELGFRWQINPSWRVEGHEMYDIKNERNQETMLGIRYDSCCWAISLRGIETFIGALQEPDQNLFLQIEFKGLASINSGI